MYVDHAVQNGEAARSVAAPPCRGGERVDETAELFLLCRVEARRCGIPLAHVVETMRPLPVERLPGMPAFVLGLAVIRGAPTPVVDAAALLGREGAIPARFVTLSVEERRVALAVSAVTGVVPLPGPSVKALPPLLRKAGRGVVAEIGALDGGFLLILQSVLLVPEEAWRELSSRSATG